MGTKTCIVLALFKKRKINTAYDLELKKERLGNALFSYTQKGNAFTNILTEIWFTLKEKIEKSKII